MRKIAVVTGTRAEYGYLKPLMQEIKKDKSLKLVPIATGMHLLSKFGNSYKIVESNFPETIKIKMPLKGDNLEDMAIYLSNGIEGFAKYFSENKTDIVVVLGDRSESLAVALVCMYLNIPIAHINGGDITGGTVDESIRHSITKIAHIHFTHNKENSERIEKMGEEKNRIHTVGALTLDTILKKPLQSKSEIFKKYKLNPDKETYLVVQHPITTLPDYGLSQMKTLLNVLDKEKKQTVMLYPNCDAGGQKLIDLIKKYEGKSYMNVVKNMPHEDYLAVMKHSELMIGNSSSGIIEAPSFKIPVINIGNRQSGRARSINIIDVKSNENEITKKINYALENNDFQKKLKSCKNEFGDGKAAERIVKILKNTKIDEKLIQIGEEKLDGGK